MPLWNIFHPVGAYTAEDKEQLAAQITELYSPLPRFYVGVVFQEVAPDSIHIGGRGPVNNFVRIWIDHIARTMPTAEIRKRFIAMCNTVLTPYTTGRGFDWEFHIDETAFELWSIQGLEPPAPNSDLEKLWRETNRPASAPAA